jgi:hypothetical protein
MSDSTRPLLPSPAAALRLIAVALLVIGFVSPGLRRIRFFSSTGVDEDGGLYVPAFIELELEQVRR